MAPQTLFVNAMGLAQGGGLTYLVNQVPALSSALPGWRIVVAVPPRIAEHASTLALAKVEVLSPFERQPTIARRVLWEQVMLPRALRRVAADVLLSLGNLGLWASPVPQIVVHHNPTYHADRPLLGGWYKVAQPWVGGMVSRRLAGRCDQVIYVSDSHAAALARVGFPAGETVHSGYSSDWPDEEPPTLAVSAPYALAVHNWYPHKNLAWLAETWGSTPALHERWQLVIVGDALFTVRGRRRNASVAADGQPHVQLVSRQTRGQVAGWYRGASLYLSASHLEAFPLTPLEAMDFGVPLVLTDIPPHHEIAGPAAAYFAPNDAASLVAAVDEADTHRYDLTAAGQVQLARLTWQRNAATVAGLVRKLAHDASAGGTAS